ncbi:MAG TPA: hypothetical protein VJQ46_00985 [Gemmatimonadales bacterium]|nr:hypothetical protein [Gemmatimonadales bacterium]
MRWRASYSYPFLFAVIPVLRLAADYPGWTELGDVTVVVLALLVASVVGYAVLQVLVGRRASRLPPLVLFGIVVAFWGYGRIAPYLRHRIGLPHLLLAPIWAGATAGLVWWLLRRPPLLDRVETFLTITGGILITWFVLAIGLAEWRSTVALRRSPLVRRLAGRVVATPGAQVGPKRDIYLIVLDEYANAEVTRRLFGFDNHVFLDSLRQLGFVVPVVHSNYLHTFLSLPSMLNSAHVAALSDELGRKALDRTLPDYLVQHNRTVRFVKSQGYQFAFFPSISWEATRHNPEADIEAHVLAEGSPARVVGRSRLRQVLNSTSLLRYIDWGGGDLVRAHVARTLAAIAEVPKIPGPPVFVFAHLLSPHTPYVFDRDCRAPRSTAQPKSDAYVAQIQCLDRLVLDMVTTVLRTSGEPAPVILLQGDHGSRMLKFDEAPAVEQVTLHQAKERLGAFGAYYLPAGGHEAFGDSVTVVNVMGNVLRFYLGADLPRQPDDMYISVDAAPFAFKRVDFPWLAREDWSGGVVRPTAAR